MPGIVVVNCEREFNDALEQYSNKLIVVDFSADWCGPCRMITPTILKLADELSNVVFIKVDVDLVPELAEKFGVTGIPHFDFFKNGRKVDSFSGASEARLRQTIQNNS